MADEQKSQEQPEPETETDYKALYEQSQKNLDFADRMRAAAHTAKDRRLSKKNGDKLSTLRSNSVIRIGDIRSSNIIRRNKQFGHKATTHRKDWIARIGALIRNPKTDGGKLKGTIATLIDKADAVVVGTTWRGQPQPRTLYRKENDLVVVNANDVYVAVRKEGALITGAFNAARKEEQE